MKKKIKVLNPGNLPTIEYSKLEDFQGDLKTITPENLEKLKNSIKKYGFFVPCFIWKNEGKFYMLDAHQRFKACALLEAEGYEIPELPYVEIQAESRKEAGEKLLQINSRYGTVNPETTFFEDFDIDLSFIDEIEIPELDIDNLMPEYEEEFESSIDKDLKNIKILNLYAGIGGNRRLWGDLNITAVEYNSEIAKAYREFFPNDKVIIEDAHKYLENHFDEYDFIWSSPPCPTHSRLRKNFGNQKPIYPDMKLYEEILFLDGYFQG